MTGLGILDDAEMDKILEINITKAINCDFHCFDTIVLKLDLPEDELFKFYDGGIEWRATEHLVGRHWFLIIETKKDKDKWNKYIIYLCLNELNNHKIAEKIAETTKMEKYNQKNAEVMICGRESLIITKNEGDTTMVEVKGNLLKINFPSNLAMILLSEKLIIPNVNLLREVCPICKTMKRSMQNDKRI